MRTSVIFLAFLWVAVDVVGQTGGTARSADALWVSVNEARPREGSVNINSISRVRDEYIAVTSVPFSPGDLMGMERRPRLTIPKGSQVVDLVHVMCGPDGTSAYAVQKRIVGPDGRVLYSEVYDAAEGRQHTMPLRYGQTSQSLVCWAAARRCAGEKLSWPPPPNDIPLNLYGTRKGMLMEREYGKRFIPACRY